jgi:D-glycero-alpha-D-manno-heptose 1-phosphate guanylyltransferase
MILAGGLGTRLRPVVSDRPKPLASVRDVPFLEILVSSLAHKGVRDFVLLTGYMGEMIEEHFREKPIDGTRVRFSREDEPLGTGGAVRNAARFATDPTLLVNGDTFFDADPGLLYEFHREKRSKVTLSLIRVDDVSRYGAVIIDEEGRVNGFREKEAENAGPGYVNAGLSLLSLEFIRELPDLGGFSMERDLFPSTALSGSMFGLAQEGAFFDIGTPESYDAFGKYLEKKGFGVI